MRTTQGRFYAVLAVAAAIVLAGFPANPASAIVTSDGSATHVLSTFGPPLNLSAWFPGAPSLDHRGVTQLLFTLNGQTSYCSSALVSTPWGPATLTAAHCLTNSSGTINVSNFQVTYRKTGGGTQTFTTNNLANVYVHPNYDGTGWHGYDLALVFYDQTIGSNIGPVYNVFGSTSAPLLGAIVKLGFGRTGYGGSAGTFLDQKKRWGLNRYGWYAFGDFNVPIPGGWNNTKTQLTLDFDSGIVANDVFAFYTLGLYKSLRLGFGGDEVVGASGDSGGPNFYYDSSSNQWVILGVNSYVFRMHDAYGPTGNSDINGVFDFTWGEWEGDAFVNTTQIYEILNLVPPKSIGAPFGPTSPASIGGHIEIRHLDEPVLAP